MKILFSVCLLGCAMFVFSKNYICDNGEDILHYHFCDTHPDCSDGSDERVVIGRCDNCTSQEISCNPVDNPFNLACVVHKDFLCNGTITCRDVTPCDVNCSAYYRCANTSQCSLRSSLCDGNSCNGCEEDTEWATGIGFKCVRNGRDCLLPQQLLRDDIKDCDNSEDLCFITNGAETSVNQSRCFQCLGSDVIIPRSKICDDVIDCPDLSDECLCEGEVPKICSDVTMLYNKNLITSAECSVGEVSCGEGVCVNRTSVCDGTMDCIDARDESFEFCRGTLHCVDGNFKLANETCRCNTHCFRTYGVMCDGVGDCPPQDIHGTEWEEEPGFPDDECMSACYHPSVPNFPCTTPFVKLNWNLDIFGSISCTIEISHNDTDLPSFIDYRVITSDHWCDGIVDCPLTMEDESEDRCPNRFRCKAGHLISIDQSKVCDGVPDCDDVSDEVNDTCSDRFYCLVLGGTKISIERKFVCDFNINCDDGSDEMNCDDDDRFYCEEGKPLFIAGRLKFDGRGDCLDWSDECPTKSKPPDHNVFSSKYELIGNPVFRVLVWIMGGVAITGNFCVLVGESRTLCRLCKRVDASATLLTNHMLVFNLALADFLMGVYLIMLGIVGAVYSGVYCAYKIDWLSSDVCSLMGVLVMMSSETSVITMVLLTTFRLYAVFNPFASSSKPNPRLVAVLIIFAWACSLVVALLPFSNHLQSVFVDKAVLRNNPFFDNIAVDFDSAKSFVERILLYDSKASLNYSQFVSNQTFLAETWDDLRDVVSRDTNHPEYLTTSQWLGYYSANSVCIPKLFVTLDVDAGSFSFALVVFNFAAFFYVSAAYILIYIKSKQAANVQKTRNLRSLKLSKALQRKIFRLIASDFCCWIPISVMAFVNFAGVKVPDIVYVISAVVLLPVNSALNPLLYSGFMDRYAEKAWRRTSEFGSTLRLSATTTISTRSHVSTTRV